MGKLINNTINISDSRSGGSCGSDKSEVGKSAVVRLSSYYGIFILYYVYYDM